MRNNVDDSTGASTRCDELLGLVCDCIRKAPAGRTDRTIAVPRIAIIWSALLDIALVFAGGVPITTDKGTSSRREDDEKERDGTRVVLE